MRKISTILMVVAFLAPAGLAIAQVPTPADAHYDLSHEFKDTPPDANGLPPADDTVPTLVLDSHAYYGVGIRATTMVPVNEWIMPELFPDGHGGRTKDVILPGLTEFRAMYGEWQDRDGSQTIDYTNDTDPNNEWTFSAYDDVNITGMKAYVMPGFHPDMASDCYLFGGQFLGFSSCRGENKTDFEYRYLSRGQWISSWWIPFTEESILRAVEVHTVADGLELNTAPGYACPTTDDDCLVDIDEYEVIDDNVAQLYDVALTIAGAQLDQVIDATDPVFEGPVGDAIQEADQAAVDAFFTAFYAVFREEVNEADPTGPHPSMLDYDYLSSGHAYLDITPWGYYWVPGAGITALRCCGMPTGPDTTAQGLSPAMLGISADSGVWHDKDGNLSIDQDLEEWSGSCDIVKTSDNTKRSVLNVTLEAVDANGNPTTWGTTGVYVVKDGGDSLEVAGERVGFSYLDEAAVDALDFRVDQYVVSGPITMSLSCDTSDPGDWFTDTVVILPEGTNGFNIRATTEDGLALRSGNEFTGGEQVEPVQDIDLYLSWS